MSPCRCSSHVEPHHHTQPDGHDVVLDLEPAPSAETIAAIYTIVDGPYREEPDMPLLED